MKGELILIVLGATLIGCGATRTQLRNRSAAELHCDAGDIKITQIDRRTKRVSGCGKAATYVESCQYHNYGASCTWILNSDIESTGSYSRGPGTEETRRGRADPPTAAGGFRFGSTVAEAMSACVGSGYVWYASGACSGTPSDIGMPASAKLGFCGDRVCTVTVQIPCE